jgi:hypothetical protein
MNSNAMGGSTMSTLEVADEGGVLKHIFGDSRCEDMGEMLRGA